MATTSSKRTSVILIAIGALNLLAALWTWNTITDLPLSREYVEFILRADSLSPEERARQQGKIQKFDGGGLWREPYQYIRLLCPPAAGICFIVGFRRWRTGAAGNQAPSSVPTKTKLNS